MSGPCGLRGTRMNHSRYHVDCNPTSYHYEAHFTIFRRKEGAVAAQNLGFGEDFGLDMAPRRVILHGFLMSFVRFGLRSSRITAPPASTPRVC